MKITMTINGKEVSKDDMFMRVSIGNDLMSSDGEAIYLMLKNPAGIAKFKLFDYSHPIMGGCISKEKAIKLRDFLTETIKLVEEYENNNP